MKLLVLLLIISGCSLSFGPDKPKSAKGDLYKVKFHADHWKKDKDDKSDYVWMNQDDGRFLISNSFCNEFQEQELQHLALKTFKTVDDFKISKQSYETFHNREAYRIEGIGKVDGVLVEIKLLNTRRDNCYFDFVGITPEKSDKHDNIFEQFINSVEFK